MSDSANPENRGDARRDRRQAVQRADRSRRRFLKGLASVGAAVGGAAAVRPAWGGATLGDALGEFFQDHYLRMSADEIDSALERIERRARERYGVEIDCDNAPPLPNTVFGYAINISRCKGYRDCVTACSRKTTRAATPSRQYIRVLQMDRAASTSNSPSTTTIPKTVPVEGKYYLPVQCSSATIRPASRPARSRRPGWSRTASSSSTTTGVSAAATA